MTPQEKAKEIVDKMYVYAIFDEAAKQCAIIAADEMINVVKDLDNWAYAYWHYVKNEIEKL